MITLIYLAGALAFALGCTVYDTVMSEKGIKAGVAVEANFTWIYGTDKPTALQYYALNIPIALLTAVPSAIALHYGSPLYYGGLAAPVVAGIVHILGGLAWRKLGVKW